MLKPITKRIERYARNIDRLVKDRIRTLTTQVYIVSYPKCGRTWLRTLLGRALLDHYGGPEDRLLSTYHLTRPMPVKTTYFVHDHTRLSGSSWRELTTDKSMFRGKDVILLIRDPRDVMVSSYFQATKREGAYSGDMAAFIRSEGYGIRKYAHWLRIWEAHQRVPDRFHLMSYEGLHTDPAGELRTVLGFIGAGQVTSVQAAVDYASFGNMRRMEQQDAFENPILAPGDEADRESFKVRRGKVGGYVDYLSAEDVAHIESVVRDEGTSFLLERYYST